MKTRTRESIRWWLALILAPNVWIAGVAAIATAFALEDLVSRGIAVLHSVIDDVKVLGVTIVIFVAIRSIVREFMEILSPEKCISCGSGIASTKYDLPAILARDPQEVYMVGQDLRTILSSTQGLGTITEWLSREPADHKRRLTIVLPTPSALAGSCPLALQHLRQTVIQLRDVQRNTSQSRLGIHFHPGAATLSAIACEKDDHRHGLLVFMPKFGVDTQAGNRLYCVIYRSEHPDLFGVLVGSIMGMTESDSLTLEQVYSLLGV